MAVDDRHFAYKLRPQSRMLQGLTAEHARTSNIVFRTIRPADYSTPYDTLLKNKVQFTAVEKNQNIFYTIGVRLPPLLVSVGL